MDRKINLMESEITDLRSRSMRDNILIHNFAYIQGENLNKRVPEVLLETLDLEVDFVRIHRNAADHRILVYRFMETSGKLCEGYWDDGEHGAGRRLLQYMQTNEILNAGAVITRWSGPIRLEQERFEIMEDHLCDLAKSKSHEPSKMALSQKVTGFCQLIV
ncbi:protein IMPACT-like [Saccostrea echinata]|uniref:protein IMPACT-like n=1 Tax=Saccostrea echinata TaxID=191078 RepID=UPI002A7FC09B|nr:protein IMPACT-like [Saccostrea echinata]